MSGADSTDVDLGNVYFSYRSVPYIYSNLKSFNWNLIGPPAT